MVKIGMMLGDRYEILEKIGTGGMSDVYKAKCHKLNRLVAVKVLKQEFSENANFVAKFKVEAQAAAGLMHPNIVNVYDVGEESGINYIVMELVEGITLKKYIEKKARLSVKESVTIAIQIAMGIEAAHNNRIIHRDIKPQNVIISKEGKVKVTDFGIAKAATSNTITSNVMGSVHYTSPEQARGGFSDEKSDVYSLGITLFEMLTGRVPFTGDTTVAIAIKQIQEEMPTPREFVDDIPVSVEQIVLKCTQKSPDRRYQSMGALIEDLKKSFIRPDENFVTIKDSDEDGATRSMDTAEFTRIRDYVKLADEENAAVKPSTGKLPKVNPNASRYDEYDSKLDKVTTILSITVGVIILAVAILLIGKALGILKLGKAGNVSVVSPSSYERIEQIVMPEVTLDTYEKAVVTLEQSGLKSRLNWEESDKYEKGIVISTSVQAGLKVDKGAEVILNVSAGPVTVVVPDVTGETIVVANKAIMDAGLAVEIVKEVSETVKEGIVMSQSPEGDERAPRESSVTIVVSAGEGEKLVEVPSVLGKDVDTAVIILTELGFSINADTIIASDLYPENQICYQDVLPGTELLYGSTIVLHVSCGPLDYGPTYRFNTSINPPSTAEDQYYVSGTEVTIIVMDSANREFFNTTTSNFPCPVNLWGMHSTEFGSVILKYMVTTEPKTTVDEYGNETVIPAETFERIITRDVNFTLEE